MEEAFIQVRAFTLAKLSHKYSSNVWAKLSHKLKNDVYTGQTKNFLSTKKPQARKATTSMIWLEHFGKPLCTEVAIG